MTGYRPSHRNKWLLVASNLLTFQELAIFDFLIDQLDFDKRHIKYGTFELDIDEVAKFFNVSSNTIRMKINKLLGLGLLRIVNKKKHIYSIANFNKFIDSSKRWGGDAIKFAKAEVTLDAEVIIQSYGIDISKNEVNVLKTKVKIQEFIKNFQKFEQNSGKDILNEPSRDLGSSKDESKLDANLEDIDEILEINIS